MAESLQDQLRKAGLVKSNARPEREQRPARTKHRQAQDRQAQAPASGAPSDRGAQNNNGNAAQRTNTAAGSQPYGATSPVTTQEASVRPAPQPITETSRDRARRAMSEKSARDRLLNLQREEQAKARARNAEVKQLIETHRLVRTDGDVVHNFVLGKKIKRLYVTREQQAQLIAGTIVIATQKDRHDLVPADVGEKIQQRDPRCVVMPRKPTAGELDDAYAAFQVPDDLDW